MDPAARDEVGLDFPTLIERLKGRIYRCCSTRTYSSWFQKSIWTLNLVVITSTSLNLLAIGSR